MSTIPSSVIRPLNCVIHLSMEVYNEQVILQLVSVVPPFVMRGGVSCGGILRVREKSQGIGGETRYALICGRYTGKWSFPKGHCEKDEPHLSCALREIEEEVGIWGLSPPVARLWAGGRQVYFLFIGYPGSGRYTMDDPRRNETGGCELWSTSIHGMV